MLAHHHKLAMTTTTTRVGIEKTRALGRGFLKKNTLYIVLESPVQSGLLPIFGRTETETGPPSSI